MWICYIFGRGFFFNWSEMCVCVHRRTEYALVNKKRFLFHWATRRQQINNVQRFYFSVTNWVRTALAVQDLFWENRASISFRTAFEHRKRMSCQPDHAIGTGPTWDRQDSALDGNFRINFGSLNLSKGRWHYTIGNILVLLVSFSQNCSRVNEIRLIKNKFYSKLTHF